jgi:PAS domain S-box-containing protein
MKEREAVSHLGDDIDRLLGEPLPMGVLVTSMEGEILGANKAFLSIAGYSIEELRSMSVESLYADPTHREQFVMPFLDGPRAPEFEVPVRQKDGTTIWAAISSFRVAIPGGERVFVSYGSDITERKKAEEELRQAKEQLDATVSALPDLMFEVDSSGRIYDYRAPRTDLLYAPPEQFIGKTVTEVLPADTARIIMDAVGEATRTGRHTGAVYSLDMQTGTCWFELSIASKGDPDRPDVRLVTLVRDVTDRKRAEEELAEYREHLEELVRERTAALEDLNERLLVEINERELAEKELLRLNEELEAYARTVSHELRTPLTGISLALEYLERLSNEVSTDSFNEEAKAIVMKAQSTVKNADDQVKRLLELAEAGQVPTDVSGVEVHSVVEEILRDIEEELSRKAASVKVDGDLGTTRANPTHIQQVFSNLIINAVRHCDSDEPRIEISLLGEDPGGGHRYLVRDNGSGIPPELIDGMFSPFVKGEGGGSGTGLAIAEKIIKIYGGSIRAYNDNGACFEFVLQDYQR